MWELATSWPLAIIGTIILGVGTNLITPFFTKQLSKINKYRKIAAIRKVEENYNDRVALIEHGLQTIEFTRLSSLVVIYCVFYCTIALASYMYLNFKQMDFGKKCIFDHENCQVVTLYLEYFSYFIGFSVLTFLAYRMSLTKRRASGIYWMIRDPDGERSEALDRITAMDPAFHQERLRLLKPAG